MWFAAVAAAATILHRARLPGELPTGELLLLGPSLAVLLAPASAGFRIRSPEGLAYLAGHTVGLILAHRWLPGVAEVYGGHGPVGSSARVLLLAVAVSAGRLLAAHAAGRACDALDRFAGARSPFLDGLGPLAGGVSFTCVHLLAAAEWRWLEALTFGFGMADLPFADRLLRGGGAALCEAVFVVLALAAIRRDARTFASAAAAAIVVGAAAGGAPEPSGSPWRVQGLQLGQRVRGFDWHAEQVAALLAAESRDVDLVIWPEGAYPYVEALKNGWHPAKLPCPEGYTRIFGMHGRGTAGLPTNDVVAQHPCGAPPDYRHKAIAAPLYEARHLDLPPDPGTRIEVRNTTVALPICYEIFDRAYLRRSGAALVINVSADQFDQTGSVARILTRVAWLRAIELGIPVVRVSDGAYSAAFDAAGRPIGLLEAGARELTVRLLVPPRPPNPARLVLIGSGALGFFFAIHAAATSILCGLRKHHAVRASIRRGTVA